MTTLATSSALHIQPCCDAEELRRYIDCHWRRGHILARNARMFDFQYRTPWVDRNDFPDGLSVLCIYEPGQSRRLLGFLGAITAPYPLPRSYWLALWHVLPELKGGGLGGRLLQRMQELAERSGAWIGGTGAGPEALPIYLKRSFCVRGMRRWMFEPGSDGPLPPTSPRNVAESPPPPQWIEYRYARHPLYEYDIRGESVFRSEHNEWGVVVHACRLAGDWRDDLRDVRDEAQRRADAAGARLLIDAWTFDCPGPGWTLAPMELPSVFHPPEARGNVIYAVGRPFIPAQVEKGDGDQDRPN
jgi:hypothetical protein